MERLTNEACARYVAAKFKQKEGVDLTLHPKAYRQIQLACQAVMSELINNGRANVVLPCIIRRNNECLHLDVMVFWDEVSGKEM